MVPLPREKKTKTGSVVSATSSMASSVLKKKKTTRKTSSVESGAGDNNLEFGERAPLLGRGKLEYTELSAASARQDAQDVPAWYTYWNPIHNILDIFVKSSSNSLDLAVSGCSGADLMHFQCIDTLKVAALLWLLTVTMQDSLGSTVSGFSAWLKSQEGYLKLISADDGCLHPLTVALVLLGHYAAKCTLVAPSSPSDAASAPGQQQQQQQQQLADYYRWSRSLAKTREFFYLSFWAVAPSLAVVVGLALLYGGLAPNNNATVECVYYTSCSKNWWTNALFVTNFTPFFTTVSATGDCAVAATDGVGNYGDGVVCFPLLWALSCGVQVAVALVPVLVLYTIKPSYGAVAAAATVVLTAAVRFIVCQRLGGSGDFAMYVAYVPWCRADAAALGAATLMYQLAIRQPQNQTALSPQQQQAKQAGGASGFGGEAEVAHPSALRASPPRTPVASFDTPGKRLRFSGGTSFLSPYSPLPGSRSGFANVSPFRNYLQGVISPSSPSFAAMEEGGLRGKQTGATVPHAASLSPSDGYYSGLCLSVLLKVVELSVAAGVGFLCLVVVVTDEPQWFNANRWQWHSVKMLAVAMLTSAVLVFFMDGSLLWPLSTLFANPLVYPLASVVYPAFLVQTLVVSMFCQSLGSAGADSFVWSGGMSNYSLLYVQLLFVNFLMALALALVVERPLYRMTRDRYRAALL